MGSNSDHCSIIVEMYWHMGSNSELNAEMYWHIVEMYCIGTWQVTVTTAQ